MNKVWLVPGSASGLGRNIAEAVLESGDRLVATARDPKRLDDLVKKYGDRVRAVPLDVTDESAAQAAVQMAVATFGRHEGVRGRAQGNEDRCLARMRECYGLEYPLPAQEWYLARCEVQELPIST